MGQRISSFALGLAALLATGVQFLPAAVAADATTTTSAAASSSEVGRVIVRFKANADSVKARAMSRAMSRGEISDIAQTRATALAMRRGLGTSAGLGVRAGRSLDERTQVVVARGISSAALAAKLAADGEVEMAVVDQRRKIAALPNDTLFGSATPNPVITGGAFPTRTIDQWYLKTPTATVASSDSDVVSSIDAPTAWDITKGAASIVVAVIDTGVRFDHPDLNSKFIATSDTTNFPSGYVGYDFIGLKENGSAASIATANDGNGADGDASDPGDWVNQADITAGTLGSSCTTSDISDSSWHGTRVAGLIGAVTNNGTGMAGVSWNSKLLPVRVLGKCGGYDSDIMAGMLWAAGISVPGVPANPNKAQVINMSLGGSGSCSGVGTGTYPGTISQVLAAGTTIVVAAGNSEGEAVGVPGNCSGVVTVAGLRHVGSKVGFSSIGSQVAISAPGGNCINTTSGTPCLFPIVSAVNLGTTGPGANDYTGNSASVGTSFSTPLVAGTVALMLSANASLTPAQVKTILQTTARPFVTSGGTAGTASCKAPTTTPQDECYCTTSTCGAGMLDAGKSVATAQAAGITTVSVTPATGSSSTVTAGQPISLSTSNTLGGNLSVASVSWTVVSGPATIASGGNSSTVVLTTTGAGSVVVSATVTDNLGITHTGQTSVTVAAAAPSGSVGVTASPTSPSAGEPITLSLDASALGSGRTIASAVWTLVDGGGAVTGFASGATATTATLSPVAAGTIKVSAQVTDNLGASYTTPTSTIDVGVAKPSGTIGLAFSPSTSVVGQAVALSVSSSLGSGRSIASATWSVASGPGALSNTTPTAATMTSSAAGTVTVQIQAVDNLGASYTAQGSITVAESLPTSTTTGGSGGGGGAFSAAWLALLAVACLALRRRPA